MQYFYQIVLQLECLTYLPKMNLFPWTAFLPEGFENGIIQKVLDRRLYGVGQHFTFWRFSRKWKFFGNFDCDFQKCFTKGFFLTENEVFRNFSFDGEFSIFTDSPLLSTGENWTRLCRPSFKLIRGKQGKQFSCVFSLFLGEYVITRLSKKLFSLFFRMHFT